MTNGEVSVAIKNVAAQGPVLTSLVGYSFIWDTLDNRKDPSRGWYANFHQDVAGLGGQSEFVRETFDGRYYYPVNDDLVAMVRLQGGQITGFGSDANNLSILNNFNVGRVWCAASPPAASDRATSRTPTTSLPMRWAARPTSGGRRKCSSRCSALPKELGLKGALFVDAGTLIGFSGQDELSGLLGYSYCPTNGVYPGSSVPGGTTVR